MLTLCSANIGQKTIAPGSSRANAGFTLIEAMVALLVLSIGLVGMAALHLTSLKSAHSSYYRSIASTVALDLEERMWEQGAQSLDSPGACITATELATIRTDLLNRWRITVSNNPDDGVAESTSVGIPNLNIVFGDIVTNSTIRPRPAPDPGTWTDRWVAVPVTLTWTETRFADDDSTQERFDYAARLPCVSEFICPGC